MKITTKLILSVTNVILASSFLGIVGFNFVVRSHTENTGFIGGEIYSRAFHAVPQGGTAGAIVLHPGTEPDAASDGRKLWLDNSNILQLLQENANPNTKVSTPVGGTSGWTDGATDVFLTNVTKKVGIGEAGPDTKLHVADGGTAGVVTPLLGTIATFESPDDGYLSILTPDAGIRGILFGEPSSNVAGGIFYNDPGSPDGF
ncbi:MAG: hypothetical protein IH946_04570, partial [Bacteroidetes bacterium]|nr:hypothetical protein [Bacteroidota bacterium]